MGTKSPDITKLEYEKVFHENNVKGCSWKQWNALVENSHLIAPVLVAIERKKFQPNQIKEQNLHFYKCSSPKRGLKNGAVSAALLYIAANGLQNIRRNGHKNKKYYFILPIISTVFV